MTKNFCGIIAENFEKVCMEHNYDERLIRTNFQLPKFDAHNHHDAINYLAGAFISKDILQQKKNSQESSFELDSVLFALELIDRERDYVQAIAESMEIIRSIFISIKQENNNAFFQEFYAFCIILFKMGLIEYASLMEDFDNNETIVQFLGSRRHLDGTINGVTSFFAIAQIYYSNEDIIYKKKMYVNYVNNLYSIKDTAMLDSFNSTKECFFIRHQQFINAFDESFEAGLILIDTFISKALFTDYSNLCDALYHYASFYKRNGIRI
jgi:hypothetical protein